MDLETLFDLAPPETSGREEPVSQCQSLVPDLTMSDDGSVSIAVDVQRANELNNFIHKSLGDVYKSSFGAASAMCEDIKNGDVDARTIEGTARLIDASVKALAEMNRFSLYLQEKMFDQKIRDEMAKMQADATNNRSTMSREKVLDLLREARDAKDVTPTSGS